MERGIVKSTCSYCGVGCGILIHRDARGGIKVQGDPDYPVNRGMLCAKGMSLHYVVEDRSDRLLFPQMRWGKGHPLQRVTLDEGLDRAAAVFKALISKYGPDSVGFYVSGQCLTEEYYIINKLVKGFLGTNNLDTNSRLCMSSAVVGYSMSFGEDCVPAAYEDIELSDCILVAGANPAWCHPIIWRRVEKHKEANPHTKIIVIDPRATQSCALADLHLQIFPGTDVILFQALGRVLIERGDIDHPFIQGHTNGFDQYVASVMVREIEEAAQLCGISATEIVTAANLIADANGFLSLWAMGLNQSSDGVSKNLALLALHLITGHVGKPGSGPLSLTGQPNAMGGREVGGMATLLASHRNLANPAHRREVADYWGVAGISSSPGFTATQMIDALEDGSLKALWVICTNPLVSLPNAPRVERALQKAKFLVVQDISSKNEAIPYADLVLPAAGWAEKSGTMTNSERRIAYLRKAIDPPGEALPDMELIQRFAQKMGFEGFGYDSVEEVFAEHAKLTRGTSIDISGLNYDTLSKVGSVQWPFDPSNGIGKARLFEDKKFYTDNGKAKIWPVHSTNELEPLSDDLPLVLTTGRVRDQWHTMTRTGKVSRLCQHVPMPLLEIHPYDAKRRKIKDGDTVIVTGKRGSVQSKARITDSIKSGVVFLPMHWGKLFGKSSAKANNLTGNGFDPHSKQPDFKYSAVEVALFSKEKQKVILVGAGAAAYRFIQTYRELNRKDEIHVFSREGEPFYNRVLLPDYLCNHKSWEDLQKFKQGELNALDVRLYAPNAITAIDRSNKTVTDQFGKIHTYDLLVLATGSRAFIPPNAPVHLSGIFSLRDKVNADSLAQYLNGEGEVTIIGGGLLGLELAASLREMHIGVTVIQLASRLMERQLDPTASSLLRAKIEEMGVKVFLNNQVDRIEQSAPKNLSIWLKSGLKLSCQAVVYAIGTRPNVELAKSLGLDCKAGVTVNAYLQTSDPSIFALGEIAEFQGKLNGITAAAEQQADIAARYINGDNLSYYKGTISMNILKFANLELCSLGIPEIPVNEDGYEEILLMDTAQSFYKKCIVHQDRLVGAILLGDKTEFAEFKELIEKKTELSEKRRELLRGASKKDPILGEQLCSCAGVGKGNLEKALSSGIQDLHTLCSVTGAGLGCGSCKPEIKNLINSFLKETV